MFESTGIKLPATERTALQETLFAVGFAIRQYEKVDLTKDLLLDGHKFLNSFSKYVRSNKNPNIVFDFAMNEEEWVESVVVGVNVLKRYRVLQNGEFFLYRGREVMEEVYYRKNEMFDKDKELPKLANDKWNPGDIWLSKIRHIPNFNSIYEYNEYISKSLNAGTLIGVSLKKAKNPHVYYIKKETDPMLYEFGGVSKPQSPFNTGISIQTTDGKTAINVRSFRTSHMAPITSELTVRGSQARHGKASIIEISKAYGIRYTSKDDIIRLSKDDSGVDKMIGMVRKLWKTCGYTYSDKDIEKFWDDKKKKGMDSVPGFFMSIINSLELGAFLKTSGNKANDIVTDIVRAASSKSELSSEFLKIY